ncbi:DNA polymerase alpha/epsilon subunit B-domain-containing protein [Collybia nuda]|uniref:DNA-directed DNA polymerase n=1 Tax=Collybia nuda TaxID=64659 RepID=A0A9P5YDD5_9AGAR|nr:DNA polymerase alpha/epsilon subunit B-domain-containing protein [Collybia nuda]
MTSIEQLPVPPIPPRASTTVLPPSESTASFLITKGNRSYKHQYANIYFIRLRMLRNFVEARAHKRWKDIEGSPILVPRVLEVIKSRLCYIVGTVYMDMPLKPNVMEDIARDHSIPPPPPSKKFYSSEDNVMLEDESGRIRLVGERLQKARLVTGVIIGALGAETANGDFEVADICYAELAPQDPSNVEEAPIMEDRMDVDAAQPMDEWIGLISGLDIGSPSPSDAQIQMLVEYLSGEEGGVQEQVDAAQISRLIIVGNSLAALEPIGRSESSIENRRPRRYGYDATTFSPHPILNLSAHLLDIASAMPIHILPGETDPSGAIMPQQPFPRAMFGAVAKLPTFSCETNPTYLRFGAGPEFTSEPSNRPSISRTFLINSGQPLDDMFRYLPSPPNTRLSILEDTLRWRHMAPTAPDTLWCHPYFSGDPFVIPETPDLYVIGNQKRFATKMVTNQDENNGSKRISCRIIMVPEFSRTGTLVLVNLRSLGVKTVTFVVEGMTGGGEVVWEPKSPYADSPPLTEPMSTVPRSSLASETE